MRKCGLYAVLTGLALSGVAGVIGGAYLSEQAYTAARQESYDRANQALYRGEENPNRHIIRPPVSDRSYYK